MTHRELLSRAALVAGALLIGVGAAYRSISLSLLDSRTFGERAAESLTDPDVATYAADRVTDALLAQKPDLIAVRPFISATANGLVSSRAFRAMAGAAASKAHEAALSEGTRRVVVALPDVEVLFKGLLETVSPEVAAKIPEKITTVVAALGDNRTAELVVDLARAGQRFRTVAGTFLVVGPLFFVLAIWLAHDRRRALVRSGTALAITGLVLLLVMPLARLATAGLVDDELTRRAANGALYHYLWPLRFSGRFLLGLGVLIAAGGRSLFEAADPVAHAVTFLRRLASPPASAGGRVLWSLMLLALGMLQRAPSERDALRRRGARRHGRRLRRRPRDLPAPARGGPRRLPHATHPIRRTLAPARGRWNRRPSPWPRRSGRCGVRPGSRWWEENPSRATATRSSAAGRSTR